MGQNLAGKIALITGGSRGIGAVIAKRLAAEGAAVTITHVGSSDTAEAIVQDILQSGGQARTIRADASEIGAGAGAVADTVAHEGGLDILVSNAGINISKSIESLSIEDYSAVFDINVRANFEIIKAAAAVMSPGSRIVVITATIANDYFAPGLALYGASKAAVNGFVQGWARDLGPRGITINAIVPGPVDTDMNPDQTELATFIKGRVPLERYGQPNEIAALASFLAGPEAGFITGARMVIDGGMSV